MKTLLRKHLPTFHRMFAAAAPTPALPEKGGVPVAVGARRRSPSNVRKWRQMFEELMRFKEEHGHFRVPANSARYVALNRWVYGQRALRRKGRLSGARLSALTDIGFPWGAPGALKKRRLEAWRANLARLDQFKNENGQVKVPFNRAEVVSLRGWLTMQTSLLRSGRLPAGRARLLRQAGVAA